ncbi:MULTISPECIES: hypothetical protein [Streptomyces]|uniref:Uncharacterized protein n=1 Tax=Streptomyces fradiae ATCC 10745 = DSM 40063 TaxID=1319510 RepID=A0ABQ6XKN3_STRFR|nr:MULTISPECIES: hypothetical protein [Streptomyces]KAF0646346.1 hypothetical protein K701_29115 [Streptomyces fradiae ATCC 10745 = DSM 40063]
MRTALTGALPPGVHHIEGLPAPAGLPGTLAGEGAPALHRPGV